MAVEAAAPVQLLGNIELDDVSINPQLQKGDH
jgi:hypothetical protein